ncbi:MAG: Ig-like domain-containing protein [Actinomycetes bacterium]
MQIRGRAATLTVIGAVLLPLGVGLARADEPTPPAPGAATITWDAAPGKDGRRALTKPLRVVVSGGTLQSVTGTATPIGLPVGSRSTPVAGTLSVDRTSWLSKRLMPARTYRVTAVAVGADGATVTQSATVRSARPAKILKASISPSAGQVVGVGMPVTVTLSRPVTAKAARVAVQRTLTVTTSRPVGDAAWAWTSSTRVQYRPRVFWPAATTVVVKARLAGVGIGKGVWATSDSGRRFTVGRSQVMKVDGRRHTFTVVRGGRTVRSGGVSLGKAGFTTRSGTKVIMSRETSRRMRSSTVGIPSGANAYDLQVPYAMRVTSSGEFVHGAPWNRYIGTANVSHGCTNLTLANAKWLYRTSMVGDPVITRGTSRRAELGNGLGGVWNVTWAQWKARSAV